jgi:hypothetical protein
VCFDVTFQGKTIGYIMQSTILVCDLRRAIENRINPIVRAISLEVAD